MKSLGNYRFYGWCIDKDNTKTIESFEREKQSGKIKDYLFIPINDYLKREALTMHNMDIDALKYNYLIYIKPQSRKPLLFEFV